MTEKKAEKKVENMKDEKDNKGNSKPLIAKIVAAVSSIKAVTKDGTNNYQHYDYTSDAQVSACTRKLLEQGVWFIPAFKITEKWTQRNSKGNVNNFVEVLGTFMLTDGVNEFKGTMPGVGADSLDKAVYKAETGAKKNFFMQLLALTTVDDTDDDHDKGLDNNNRNYGNQNRHQAPKIMDKKQDSEIQNLIHKINQKTGIDEHDIISNLNVNVRFSNPIRSYEANNAIAYLEHQLNKQGVK